MYMGGKDNIVSIPILQTEKLKFNEVVELVLEHP